MYPHYKAQPINTIKEYNNYYTKMTPINTTRMKNLYCVILKQQQC